MLNIKDVEEKRLIVAYFIARTKNCNAFEETVWNNWTSRWAKDFKSKEGKPLKRYNHQCVISKTQAKKAAKLGALTQDYKEYDDFIIETSEWVRSCYDKNKGHRKNANMMKGRLFAYRKACDKNIRQFLDENGLIAKGYKLQNQTSKKYPYHLGYYLILHRKDNGNKCVVRGSYDQVMDYLKEKVEEL